MRRRTWIILLSLLLSACNKQKEGEWIPLFDGQQLPGYHYLGIPDSSIHGLDLERDSSGQYIRGLGYEDPLEVFSVLEGEGMIRISGQVVGGLVLADSMKNYHLKLRFRWGDHLWDWMEGRPRDGGILYHQGRVRHEFQIHEGDVGSYWAKKVRLDIPARYTHAIPEAIHKARPFLVPLVNTLHDSMLVFDPAAGLHNFDGSGGPKDWQIVLAHPYNENARGEWNELELICWENHAVHIVNGRVNMIILNSFQDVDGESLPLDHGRLTLQSEGAVIYFRDIVFRTLTRVPGQLRPFLE